MSWWLSLPTSTPEDLEKTARDAQAANDAANPGLWTDEAREQFEHALDAAKALVAAVKPGELSHEVIVILSGHANPLHHPTPGYAADVVTVSVTQSNVQTALESPPPLPSVDNPVPIEIAKQAADAWEGNEPTTEEESTGEEASGGKA